jgi:EpsI family protein
MNSTRHHLRFWAAVLILTAAAVFLHSRSSAEVLPPRAPLDAFPTELGDWRSRTITIEPEILQILGNGEFLQRIYYRGDAAEFFDVFLAYFPSQRTGSTIHSPKNCLPGAGWSPVESNRVPLTWPDGRTFSVNEYVIARGLDRQVALYWYQAHGRAVASEYWAKFYLVADAIRTNRSDGALVRVLTPVRGGESLDAARARAHAFATQLLPHLDKHIPE